MQVDVATATPASAVKFGAGWQFWPQPPAQGGASPNVRMVTWDELPQPSPAPVVPPSAAEPSAIDSWEPAQWEQDSIIVDSQPEPCAGTTLDGGPILAEDVCSPNHADGPFGEASGIDGRVAQGDAERKRFRSVQPNQTRPGWTPELLLLGESQHHREAGQQRQVRSRFHPPTHAAVRAVPPGMPVPATTTHEALDSGRGRRSPRKRRRPPKLEEEEAVTPPSLIPTPPAEGAPGQAELEDDENCSLGRWRRVATTPTDKALETDTIRQLLQDSSFRPGARPERFVRTRNNVWLFKEGPGFHTVRTSLHSFHLLSDHGVCSLSLSLSLWQRGKASGGRKSDRWHNSGGSKAARDLPAGKPPVLRRRYARHP